MRHKKRRKKHFFQEQGIVTNTYISYNLFLVNAIVVRRTYRCSLAIPRPLERVSPEIERLHSFWQTLTESYKLAFLEGLPEAEACVYGSSEGSDRSDKDLVRDLVLTPVAWCYKVRRRHIIERLQYLLSRFWRRSCYLVLSYNPMS